MSGEVVMARGLTRVYQEEAVPVHALRGVDFSLSSSRSSQPTIFNNVLDHSMSVIIQVYNSEINAVK